MRYSSFLVFLIMIFGQHLLAQDSHDDHSHHDHHKNEVGVANALVYSMNEKEAAYGLHMHYVRNIGESGFGVGLGYERIYDEHRHNTLGIVGSYRPADKWGFVLSPGVTFEDHESSHLRFAIHVETSYEFELHDFHIGPVVEFAHAAGDNHISIGIHIGYGF